MSFHFSESRAVDEERAAAKSEEMNAKDPCTVGRGGDLARYQGWCVDTKWRRSFGGPGCCVEWIMTNPPQPKHLVDPRQRIEWIFGLGQCICVIRLLFSWSDGFTTSCLRVQTNKTAAHSSWQLAHCSSQKYAVVLFQWGGVSMQLRPFREGS